MDVRAGSGLGAANGRGGVRSVLLQQRFAVAEDPLRLAAQLRPRFPESRAPLRPDEREALDLGRQLAQLLRPEGVRGAGEPVRCGQRVGTL